MTLTQARSYNSNIKMDPNDPDIKSLDENIWFETYKEDLGITVENLWTAENSDYEQKWMTSMVSGDLPDFGMVSSKIYKQLLEADLIMDMTDIFEQYASEEYKAWNEREDWMSYNAITEGGRLYGLPVPGYTPQEISLFFIRQDWLDAVGKEVPKTIDELEDVMDAFIEAKLGGEDTLGMASSQNLKDRNFFITGVLEGYGAFHNMWLEEDGKLIYSNTTQEFKDGLLRLQEWYKKGYVREDFLALDSAHADEDIASGKCGIVYGIYYTPLSAGIGGSYQNDENAEWVVAEIPTVDGSPAISTAWCKASIDRSAFFVSKDCKNPEAVVKLINFSIAVKSGSSPQDKYPLEEYYRRADGTEVFKFSVIVDMNPSWANLYKHYAVMDALETGNVENLDAAAKITYDQVYKVVNDEDPAPEDIWTADIFGEDGSYAVIDKMRNEGRIKATAYATGSTETMLEKSKDLQTNLEAAMFKVIMGEDISVYEEALDTWFKTGGEQISAEVNEWYAAQ